MAVLHDLICSRCSAISVDAVSTLIDSECIDCHAGRYEIYYGNWGKRNAAALDARDSVSVYRHPKTKKIVYPGRNDVAMPERYRAQGYERVTMRSLRDIDKFSREHGVVNEAAHYNSGNAYDSESAPPAIDTTGLVFIPHGRR